MVVVVVSILWSSVSGGAQSRPAGSSRPEEIEWTWEVRPTDSDPKLPNVLLVGDSISRNYYPEVRRSLRNVANVYLLATSASIGDPRLSQQLAEFVAMEKVHFRVVHFNNGMHGWSYSEGEYRQAFPAFLASIRAMSPDASLVWASTTPVKADAIGGATNDRVSARNAVALAFVSEANIAVDDQHALMLKHLDTYQDTVHFNDEGSQIQGRQAAEHIRVVLR
ncbi:MAG: SGNH/GDSL hydrolase family protein [Formivibrio sp.]|nr:SGNH/GDSL hydrolase family protein [Formivibrio sp.]